MSALTRAIEGRNAPSDPTPPLHTGDIAYDAIGEVWLYQPVDFRGPIELVPAAKIGGGGADVSPTPPDNPSDGDLWWNTSATPNQLYISVGGVWQPVSDLSTVLHLSGGTMTGPIILAGDATQPLQPTTLQQMTAAISAGTAAYLPLIGGTLTGNLGFNSATGTGQIAFQNAGAAQAAIAADPVNNRLAIQNLAGNAIATFNWTSNLSQFWGNLALNSLPTTNPGSNQVWTGSNGALIVGTGPTGGGFLPLGGGTLSGLLTLQNNITLNNSVSAGTNVIKMMNGSNLQWTIETATNNYFYLKNSTAQVAMQADMNNRNFTFQNAVTVNGGLNANATIMPTYPLNSITMNCAGYTSGITWQVNSVTQWRIGQDNLTTSGFIQKGADANGTNRIIEWRWDTSMVTIDGALTLKSVPTADPHVVGQVWSNAGALYISAG